MASPPSWPCSSPTRHSGRSTRVSSRLPVDPDRPARHREAVADVGERWIDGHFLHTGGAGDQARGPGGGLSTPSLAALPAVAAIGGMLGPALLYLAFTWGDSDAVRGWAIPTATDIAFALGMLAVLGSRVPASLKDLPAGPGDHRRPRRDRDHRRVLHRRPVSGRARACRGRHGGTDRVQPRGHLPQSCYVLVGVFLWVCVLKSGVHATLAGVLVGLAVPLHAEGQPSPLRTLEHDLHPWVTFLILPIFAFANAGVRFTDISASTCSTRCSWASRWVCCSASLSAWSGRSGSSCAWDLHASRKSSWQQIVGIGFLTGIGFTMSLFIGSLAFSAEGYNVDVRVGVLLASVLAAVSGYFILLAASRRPLLSSKAPVSR